MIRMIQSQDAAHAKGYFGDALSRPDYYINDQELPGVWQGRLAERLGLAGETRREDFFALCENRHPKTDGRLTPSTKKNRRTGYDINFHCPKSVSLLHALSHDDRVLTAFRESVHETMQVIEGDSQTRVRIGGRSEDRRTGELVWAQFVHQTARPVAGSLPDPHLHAHCFVFNATWDGVEGRIKAGQFGEIQHDMPFYQTLFQKTLADKLAGLGYPIRLTETSFEIEGMPKSVIALFSKRTNHIGQVAKEKGITDAKDLDALARTRVRGWPISSSTGSARSRHSAPRRRQRSRRSCAVRRSGKRHPHKIRLRLGGRSSRARRRTPARAQLPTRRRIRRPRLPCAKPSPRWRRLRTIPVPHCRRNSHGRRGTHARVSPPDPAQGASLLSRLRAIFGRAATPAQDPAPETRPEPDKDVTRTSPLDASGAPETATPHDAGNGERPRQDRPAPPASPDLPPQLPVLTAKACVDYALLHGFTRASVMDGRRLLGMALNHAIGRPSAPIDEIVQQFATDPRLIHVQEKTRTLCTTKEVLREEQHMVALARAGQGAVLPLYTTVPDIPLTGQQRQAVEHILTTTHRVSIIRGVAGSGKTTLMPEAVAQIERAGKTVMTVAPSARAARGTLKEGGFKDATTVASLLESKTLQEKLGGQVLWVDEAGLLGTEDMTALLELTQRQNTRLILAGDTRQHASVRRGDALRILNTVAQIPVAEVTHIRRQTTAAYRDAVKDLSNGKVASAFDKLDAMGSIKDLGEHDPVREYIDTLKRGKTALMISPTHAQGEAITAKIRASLRDEGLLGKTDVEVMCLKPLHRTEAEKSDPRSFAPGQILQFTQNASGGFARGSRWTVDRATDTAARIVGSDGKPCPLPIAHNDRFEVFDRRTLPLSIGDPVRITHNGFDARGQRLNNGDVLRVVAIGKDRALTLQNDISRIRHTIDPEFGHIAHAHCITSQAAQSRTVDEVFIFQPSATFPATDAKQFYVSVSRGKQKAHIYTDDRPLLLAHAAHLRERKSAIELTGHISHKAAPLHHQQPNIPRPRPRTGGRDYDP